MEFAGAVGVGEANSQGTQSVPADVWRAAADAAMATVASVLTDAPFGPATDAIQDYRDTLVAVEALLIAQRKKAGHSDRANEGVIKNSGRVSKAEAKRRTLRADVVEKNPALATKLTTGDLSTEKVDLLADASAKTEGAAATDATLIGEVSGANPDQARAIVRKFVDDHTDQNSRDTRYALQRKRRKVSKTRTSSGMSAIIIEGDDESIHTAFTKIRRRADRLYRADGGREVSAAEHERTHHQRMYDAAMAHLAGDAAEPVRGQQSSAPTSHRNRPGERPVMVFRGNLSDISSNPDTTLDWECELIGTGRVPTAVAEYYGCISDHAAQLVSDVGEVLWQGRTKRMVTRGQWLALVVRDGGCCLCGLDQTYCEAHHLIPWSAPAKGETNIDGLALVCVDCHHQIHDNRLTLYHDATVQRWRLRAARPEEVAPVGKRRHVRQPRSPSPTPERRSVSGAATGHATESFGERVRR